MRKQRYIIIITFCLFTSIAAWAQINKKTDLYLEEKTLNDFFLAIEEKTDFTFMYINVDLDQIISIDVEQATIGEILNRVLTPLSLSYEVRNKQILIKESQIVDNRDTFITITGIVTDHQGEPLIGANVVEKNSLQGIITDMDGSFSLSVRENATLLVSYIGFISREIPVRSQRTFRIQLNEDTKTLSEVVVVGYGTLRKAEVGSAITSVRSENFIKVPSPDAAQLIRGQVAGLAIISSDANPLATSQLSLRGITTLRSSTNPLILIDGIPGELNSISPDEIEQIDVLKDGSAAAIYGTRGTNGVILITTKTPKGEMPTTVELNSYLSVQQITRKLGIMTAEQYREKVAQSKQGAVDYDGNVDWLDEITRVPFSQVYNISLRGGSRTTNYTASIEYRGLEGIIKRSDNQVIYPRIEVSHRMFQDKLRINAGLSGFQRKYFDGSDGNGYKTDVYAGALQFNPTDPVRDENGAWKERSINDYLNPLALLWEVEGENKETNMRMFANITFSPIDDLDIKYMASSVTFNQIRGYYETKQHSSTTKYGRNGYASRGTRYTLDNMSELTAQYRKTLWKDHSFTLLAGYSWMKNEYQDYWMQNWDFPSDDYTYNSIGAGQALRDGRAEESSYKSENKLIGYFGRLNYNFRGRYILSASIRREGSSKFGENHKWGTFPALSVAWNISEETFMQNIPSLRELRLRAGFGVTGTVPTDPYMSLDLLDFSRYTYFNGEWIKSIRPASNANPDLRWEKKEEVNIGLDAGFFNDRISGSVDFYNRETRDLIWSYTVPSPPYLYSTMTANAGSIRNRGIEVSLRAIPVQTNVLQWNTNINYSTNKNKLLTLSNDQFVAGDYTEEGWTGSPIQQHTHIVKEGWPVGNFWGYKTIDIDDNGHWIIEGADGNPKPIADCLPTDKQVLGNGLPKHYLNWNNSLTYKNFDVGLTMRGAFGFRIWNAAEAFHAVPAMLNAGWNTMEKAFDNVFDKRPLAQSQELAYVSYHIENGSYWKIDNLTFGYTWHSKFDWLKSIRIYGSVSNLAVITGYGGIDPEVGIAGLTPGVDDRYRYPAARTYTIGTSFKF